MTNSATFTTPEASDEDLGDLLLEVLPPDGSTIGNMSAREALGRASGRQISEEEYESVKGKALGLGLVVKGRGRVVLNWNIIKAPHGVVDYVVIHELCHLIHPNHSKDFWQLVGRHDAAYPEHRQWLKERGEGLL